MAERRILLHEALCGLLGSRNVYFQPPSSIQMSYPAIVYSLSDIKNDFADNQAYSHFHAYTVTVIDKDPDNETVCKIAGLSHCRFNRSFKSENLNHYVFTLYF